VSAERYDTVHLGTNNALSRVGFALITLIPRAIGLILRLLVAMIFPRLGGALAPRGGGTGRNANNAPDSVQVPGTPFIVQGTDGNHYDCYLRGELRGGALRLGDQVEVSGRMRTKTGVLAVDKVVSHRTGAITTGYIHPRARAAGARAMLQFALVVILVLLLIAIFRSL
jgi:hypothetical protein